MDDVTIEGGNFVTKTVSGFLDFTTTVGNTVMVFTPEGGVKRKKRMVEQGRKMYFTAYLSHDSFLQ